MLVTQAGVEKYLASLDTTKSCGLDRIHPRVLRECAVSFAIPLCLIFRQSLKEGEVPDLWRRANVTALFKKDSKLQPSYFRPVSLTSVPCKALESLVREAIMDHCERAGVISKKQLGFVFKRACVTNLLESLDIMTQAIYDGFAVDVIYTDFAKAFDTAPYRRLLQKLRAYGIEEELYVWIEAWLKNRKQRVVLGEHRSEWKTVSSDQC